jgi:hypothetical protein
LKIGELFGKVHRHFLDCCKVAPAIVSVDIVREDDLVLLDELPLTEKGFATLKEREPKLRERGLGLSHAVSLCGYMDQPCDQSGSH